MVAGAVGALAMGVVSSGIFLYTLHYVEKSQEAEQAQYEKQLADDRALLDKDNAGKQHVYIITHDIDAGIEIKATDLAEVDIPKSAVPDNMVIDKSYPLHKFSKIAIHKNTPLTKTMFYEDGITPSDLRNEEWKTIVLPDDLKVNQYVDVRIKFPTGQDYIVLSKKKVNKLENTTLYLAMDEKETLLMSSATVDAYLQGATIYAVSYVDPYVQGKSAVDYPVNARVKDLIIADPNILAQAKQGLEEWARMNLESALNEMDPAQKAKVAAAKAAAEQAANGSSGTNSTSDANNSTGSGYNPFFNSDSQPVVGPAHTPSSSTGSNSTKSNPPSGQTQQPSSAAGQSKDTQKSIFQSSLNSAVTP